MKGLKKYLIVFFRRKGRGIEEKRIAVCAYFGGIDSSNNPYKELNENADS